MASCIFAAFVSLLAVYSVQCAVLVGENIKVDADDFDWRTKGVISPVSNQGQVGDSTAFVIAEGVESLYAIQTGQKVVRLSRQELADCCDDPNHQPKYKGFDCISYIGGLCTEATYKHTGPQICNNRSCLAIGKVTGTGYIHPNREDLMLQTIHHTPLSAYLDASHASFEEYISGVYSESACSPANLDHVVQIVGYGSTEGQDYWIIKNSWGTTWGEQGYMRIARGKNMCGIASSVFYPINKF